MLPILLYEAFVFLLLNLATLFLVAERRAARTSPVPSDDEFSPPPDLQKASKNASGKKNPIAGVKKVTADKAAGGKSKLSGAAKSNGSGNKNSRSARYVPLLFFLNCAVFFPRGKKQSSVPVKEDEEDESPPQKTQAGRQVPTAATLAPC